jgi:uncharacterized protein YigE (DUF2233 family)
MRSRSASTRSGSGWQLNIERKRSVWLRFAAAGLFAVAVSASAADEAGTGAAPVCRRLAFEARHYVACYVDVRRFELAVAWGGSGGKPYGSIESYLRQLPPADRPRLVFAMNGGMYEPDFSPVGLLIEHGREQARLNTRRGTGNFYWKPNGVFFAGEGRVGILEAGRYLKERPRAEFATQSGPVLVTKGFIGKRMLASASSEKIRNGVGVRDENTAIFVISEEPVSFSGFARLFRDALFCPDALYLDGTISQLYAPSVGRTDQGHSVGPIVAAFSRPASQPAR